MIIFDLNGLPNPFVIIFDLKGVPNSFVIVSSPTELLNDKKILSC